MDALTADRFHAHLDVCPQCEQHPFHLCSTGAALLGVPQDRTAGALVPLNPYLPIGGFPRIPLLTDDDIVEARTGRDREALMRAITDLAWEARIDGHLSAYHTLLRVVRAMRGARGVDLEYELLIFLEREGVL